MNNIQRIMMSLITWSKLSFPLDAVLQLSVGLRHYQIPTSRDVKLLGCCNILSVGDEIVANMLPTCCGIVGVSSGGSVLNILSTCRQQCSCSGVWHLTFDFLLDPETVIELSVLQLSSIVNTHAKPVTLNLIRAGPERKMSEGRKNVRENVGGSTKNMSKRNFWLPRNQSSTILVPSMTLYTNLNRNFTISSCCGLAGQHDSFKKLHNILTSKQVKYGLYLNSTTVTPLHQIANVFWLHACSNEWLNIVMTQFFQLQTKTRDCTHNVQKSQQNICVKKLTC